MVLLGTEAGWVPLLGTVEHSVLMGTEHCAAQPDIELGVADWLADIELGQ